MATQKVMLEAAVAVMKKSNEIARQEGILKPKSSAPAL
jgi:hypothetical protein